MGTAFANLIRSTKTLTGSAQKFLKQSEIGKRFTDKLFKVWRHNGEATWILVHVEIQAQKDDSFAERMFVYNYRCFDRYQKPVVSIAVLGDEQADWRPSSYSYDLGGCRMGIEFPIVKLIDYESRWPELATSRNPFVVMVMAHLKTKATTQQLAQRKQWKWQLVRQLFEQGYSRKDILQLFRLVDWMMTLPEELEEEFRTELRQYQEERRMPYITSIERLAKEEGKREGKEEGKREGKEEGKREGKEEGKREGKEEGIQEATLKTLQESIVNLLMLRFESVPPELVELLNNLEDIALLRQLLLQSVTTASLEEFQQLLLNHSSQPN